MADLTPEQHAAVHTMEASHADCHRTWEEATKAAVKKRDAAIAQAHSQYSSDIAQANQAYIASPGYTGILGSRP